MAKKTAAEPKKTASRQDVINKVDEIMFALNEHRPQSTDEPVDFSIQVDTLQLALDDIKKLNEPKEKKE